ERFRSIPDTGVRLDRQPAHPLEDPLPPDAPDLVPDEIADHGARERQRRREPQTKAAVPCQGAGPEEKRLSRHRRHELFEDHSAKKSRIAVHPDEEIQRFHSKFRETLLLPRAAGSDLNPEAGRIPLRLLAPSGTGLPSSPAWPARRKVKGPTMRRAAAGRTRR